MDYKYDELEFSHSCILRSPSAVYEAAVET